MRTLYAFFLGMWEFRRAFTTRFCQFDYEGFAAYDKGREFAHSVTFRWFDQ